MYYKKKLRNNLHVVSLYPNVANRSITFLQKAQLSADQRAIRGPQGEDSTSA